MKVSITVNAQQRTDEVQPRLLPAPTGRYDLPIYTTAKVHRDHHI